jgi:trimethylamine--corrinoid protein Co-methyltransferase
MNGEMHVELIKALSEGQIERIREGTEEILETHGLKVTHPYLQRLCLSAGAEVSETSGMVRFPRPLLRELLATVPSSYTIGSVGGARHVIGGGEQYAHAIVTDPWIIDYQTQRPRRPCLEDVRRHTIIAQQLDVVAGISLMDFPVTDVEEPFSSLRAFEEHMLYHDKHILIMASGMERYEDLLEVTRIAGRDEDLSRGRSASVAVGMLSPLAVSDLNAEFLLSACANNLPVVPTVCPIAGMTSPYSMAGTLLQGNVECVGLAALTQVVRRGHPYQYSFGPSLGHMRYMHDMYYTLDKVLWKLATVQLARSYHLPVTAECGGSMTYRYDQQNGAEGMLFMTVAANSGSDLIAGIGSTYNAIGMSAEMMLIHTAWLAAARYLQRGMAVDDQHMGIESMKRAGPGGNFMLDDLTVQLLRSGEFFTNDLFDYAGGVEALADSPSLLQRAHRRVEQMAAEGSSPLPEQVQESIRRFFADRRRKLS